jgi:hypothetical protein
MGDNFLKQQVRNFKKGQDKALDSLSKPTLFIAPEALGKTFPVFEVNGYAFAPQDILLAVPSRTPGRIEIVRGTHHVGFAEGDVAKPLLDVANGGGVYVRVESRNDLSGVAQVRIVPAGETA